MVYSNDFSAVYMASSKSAQHFYAGHLNSGAFQLPTVIVTVGGLLLVGCVSLLGELLSIGDAGMAAVGATVATGVACVLLLAALITDPQVEEKETVEHGEVDVLTFAMAFGTIFFSFGGAPAFPTIQHDMNRSSDFPKAISLGFSILLLMYLPVSAAAFFLFGDRLKDNVLMSLDQTTWMFYSIQALICAHLLFAFTIIINPLCQELEMILKLPHHFTWKRAVFRTFCVILVLFTAETLPHFGPILSLLGGSTNVLMSVVFPCSFYLKLCSMENLGWPERKAALHEKVFSIQIIIIGLIGGVVSTYSAIRTLAHPDTFIPPCYMNITDI